MQTIKRLTRAGVLLPAALAWLACGGCGRPTTSTSSEEATVNGAVTIMGKPATQGGTITFNPANVTRKDAPPREAPLDKDGRYRVTTLVGQNTVTVRLVKPPRDADLRRATRSINVAPGPANSMDVDVPTRPVPVAAR